MTCLCAKDAVRGVDALPPGELADILLANNPGLSITQIDKAAGPVFMRSYAPSMIPTGCTPASVGRLAKAVDELQGLSSGTRRALLVAHQDDALCVAIRGKMTVR